MEEKSDNTSGMLDKDSVEKVKASASVELRSDPVISGKGRVGFFSGFFSNKKMVGIFSGWILILIILGFGVYAGLRQQNGNGFIVRDDGGVFGDLPGASNRENKASLTHSGLSGVTCDHPTRRPIGVMLAGDTINRPVSGFAKADMVFELPVLVSGITRLLAVYQCGEPSDIGSVRSARHDYLFLAEGVDAIMGHWGGSYHALNRIAAGEFDTINALGNPFSAFFRKDILPAPYNGFTTYERLWNSLQKLGYRTTTEFDEYEFKDDMAVSERPVGGTLSIAWPGAYRVWYEYNAETNRYDRYWAGVKQVDGEDGAQVAPSSVVVMRATNGYAEGPGGYNDVGIEGTGDLTVYQDGKAIPGTWRKDERYKDDPVHMMNENGDPMILTRGQIWIMAVEPDVSVTWQVEEEVAPEAGGQVPAQ